MPSEPRKTFSRIMATHIRTVRRSGIWWHQTQVNKNLGFWVIGNHDERGTSDGRAWNYADSGCPTIKTFGKVA